MEDTLKLILSKLESLEAGQAELKTDVTELKAYQGHMHEDMIDRFESQGRSITRNANQIMLQGKKIESQLNYLETSVTGIYACLNVTDDVVMKLAKQTGFENVAE